MITSINELLKQAQKQKTKTLVVACAADPHVIEAVEMAKKDDIIHPILVGNKHDITAVINDHQYDVAGYDIIDISDDIKACEKAVELCHNHPDYVLMKGLVGTSTILRAALDKEQGLRTKNRISHVSVMEIPSYPKLLFMTDGAMNIAPSLDDKRQIIENSVHVARALGIKTPQVGVIGAVEKVNQKMQATVDAVKLKKMNESGIISNCIVDGPFAIDNAVNKEAAKHKGITSSIAGEVDILLMPQIEAGNVFYKTMMFLCNAKSASVIAGASRPIVLTSRADSTLSKFHSIALASIITDN